MIKTLDKNSVVPGKNAVDTLFNSIDKTIIFCRTQAQAKRFYNTLYTKLDGKVLKSLSEDKGDSSEFVTFANDDSIKVLVLVRKGRLGFDMSHLYNIVDFTLTTNVDNISQMLGRILRTDNDNTLKHYYKVSPENTVVYFQAIMMVVLRLTMQDAFEIYDGNQNKVNIPKFDNLDDNNDDNNDDENNVDVDWDSLDIDDNTPTEPSLPPYNNVSSDFIMDLNFFTHLKSHSNGSEFGIYSSCTLDDVRREVLNITRKERTLEECIQEVKDRGYTRKIEFQYGSPAHYAYIQSNGLMDDFVIKAGLKGKTLRLTKEQVKECADQCISRTDFRNKFQPKYKKAKDMGWLNEWFGEIEKSGPKVGKGGSGRWGNKGGHFSLK
jgi:superfamily II DNA or RNA helicase